MRGATDFSKFLGVVLDVSIHAPHAGRDRGPDLDSSVEEVSIHAPHAGRDGEFCDVFQIKQVSIHAPHAGRDR